VGQLVWTLKDNFKDSPNYGKTLKAYNNPDKTKRLKEFYDAVYTNIKAAYSTTDAAKQGIPLPQYKSPNFYTYTVDNKPPANRFAWVEHKNSVLAPPDVQDHGDASLKYISGHEFAHQWVDMLAKSGYDISTTPAWQTLIEARQLPNNKYLANREVEESWADMASLKYSYPPGEIPETLPYDKLIERWGKEENGRTYHPYIDNFNPRPTPGSPYVYPSATPDQEVKEPDWADEILNGKTFRLTPKQKEALEWLWLNTKNQKSPIDDSTNRIVNYLSRRQYT
jgi:hypothetical protein